MLGKHEYCEIFMCMRENWMLENCQTFCSAGGKIARIFTMELQDFCSCRSENSQSKNIACQKIAGTYFCMLENSMVENSMLESCWLEDSKLKNSWLENCWIEYSKFEYSWIEYSWIEYSWIEYSWIEYSRVENFMNFIFM